MPCCRTQAALEKQLSDAQDRAAAEHEAAEREHAALEAEHEALAAQQAAVAAAEKRGRELEQVRAVRGAGAGRWVGGWVGG